jgi:hypothetical protein
MSTSNPRLERALAWCRWRERTGVWPEPMANEVLESTGEADRPPPESPEKIPRVSS